MAQRERGAAAGARPAARTRAGPGARPTASGAAGAAWTGPDLVALRARLRSVIEPLVAAASLDLENLAVTRAGRRHVVRVTVDGDGGVGHNELSDIARDISVGLDAAEESGGELTANSYTLEVSSPGVDRPLTLPRHWRRNMGRLVTVKDGGRTLTARVVAADDVGVTFDVAGRKQTVAFEQLGPGRVQVEFTRLAELADEEFGEEFDGDDHDGDDHDGDGQTEQEERA